MGKRVFNFYAGPATLPYEVIKEASENVLDFMDLGLSIIEISHRSKEFDDVIKKAASDMKDLLNLGDEYSVLFLQGGASLQFAMIPMNFLGEGETADYIDTGRWSSKAIKEAKLFGNVNVVASSSDKNYTYIPDVKTLKFTDGASYVHITSNNTIYGTQFHQFPDTGNIPLVVDMSSDFMCRELDMNRFSLVYAGAQKNVGPAGVTVVIIKRDMLERIKREVPIILKYETHVEKDSLYNTPSVFGVYVIGLVMKWLKKIGGLKEIERINREKAKLLYDAIDDMSDFYRAVVDKDSRSIMNVTFRIVKEELEAKFVEEAKKNGMVGLKGHRSVGGLRASIYNAMSLEGVKTLVEFMKDFARRNG